MTDTPRYIPKAWYIIQAKQGSEWTVSDSPDGAFASELHGNDYQEAREECAARNYRDKRHAVSVAQLEKAARYLREDS
jgi:hypothetical protein